MMFSVGLGLMIAAAGCSKPVAVVPSGGPASPPSSVSSPVTNAPEPDPSLPAGVPTAPPAIVETPSRTLDGVAAVITIASVDIETDALMVGGFVSGLVEDGGTCIFSVTGATGIVTEITGMGVENKSSTSCGSNVIPRSELGSGSVTVTLRYVNSHGEVTSEPVEVKIS